MSSQGQEPTEDEIRAALEEQMRSLRVEEVVLQTVVTLINLGARRAGLSGGDESEHDLEQARIAIEAVRGLFPLVEPAMGPDAKAIRDALSQLQLAYVRAGGTAPAEEAPGGTPPGAPGAGPAAPPKPEEPESAVKSGRLWVPGQ